MARHEFTKEECSRGGKKRAAMLDFDRHCEFAYGMLQAKRPDCWRWIYRNRVAPYMQSKQEKQAR